MAHFWIALQEGGANKLGPLCDLGNIYTPVMKTSGLMNMQRAMMKILESLEKLACYWAQARVPFIEK